MRFLRFTVCIVVALLLVKSDATIKQSVLSSLSKIAARLNEFGKDAQARVTKITDFLNSTHEGGLVDIVSHSVEIMGVAVDEVTSSDVNTILNGALALTSVLPTLIPVYGSVISSVFGVAGMIIGVIGGSLDIGSIVRKEIETALNNYDDSELRAEALGTVRVYMISQAFLNQAENESKINEHEVAVLSSTVPVTSGIKFLGVLNSKIIENAMKSDKIQAFRAVEYTRLYVSLSVMKYAIFWEMFSVIREAANNEWTAAAIKRVIDAEKKLDSMALQFISKPVYSKARFFTYLTPSRLPLVKLFMSKIGLSFQRLDELTVGKFHLQAKKYLTWYLLMTRDGLYATELPPDKATFYFGANTEKDKENNMFFIASAASKYSFVVAHDSVCDQTTLPLNGKWKLIKFEDDSYLISPAQWPDKFLSLSIRRTSTYFINVYLANDIPGPEGRWIIKRVT